MSATEDPGPAPVPMAAVRAATARVTDLLVRVGGGQARPPRTSQERRRTAVLVDEAAGELTRAVGHLDRWLSGAGVPERPDPLAAEVAGEREGVAHAQQVLHAARIDLQHAVDLARGRGASWRQIGGTLGISGQTAHKRFDPGARRRHADYMRRRAQQQRRD